MRNQLCHHMYGYLSILQKQSSNDSPSAFPICTGDPLGASAGVQGATHSLSPDLSWPIAGAQGALMRPVRASPFPEIPEEKQRDRKGAAPDPDPSLVCEGHQKGRNRGRRAPRGTAGEPHTCGPRGAREPEGGRLHPRRPEADAESGRQGTPEREVGSFTCRCG